MKNTQLLRTSHLPLLPWNILIISKNYRSLGNTYTLRHSHTHTHTLSPLTHIDSLTHTYTHTELFLVEPVACLSSGLLWVLAAFPACLSPLPQSAALPFNKRHLNLNKQAQPGLSFNLPLKDKKKIQQYVLSGNVCLHQKRKPKHIDNLNQINIHCILSK